MKEIIGGSAPFLILWWIILCFRKLLAIIVFQSRMKREKALLFWGSGIERSFFFGCCISVTMTLEESAFLSLNTIGSSLRNCLFYLNLEWWSIWILEDKGGNFFLSNCVAASMGECNKVIWYYELSW